MEIQINQLQTFKTTKNEKYHEENKWKLGKEERIHEPGKIFPDKIQENIEE
jgi:hypothetical protein